MIQQEGRQSAAVIAGAGSQRQALLEGLACPGCGRPLEAQSARAGGQPAGVYCSACHRRWPIRQRTPVFLPGEHEDPMPTGAATLLHAPDVEHWESLCRTLERWDPGLHEEVFDLSRDDWRFLLPLPPGTRALVLGCGWGRLAASLSDLCERVYAVDAGHVHARFVNARAFAEGRRSLLGVTARLGSLPFTARFFDLIVIESLSALGQRGDWRHLLANLVRLRSLLAPEGALLVRAEFASRGLAGGLRARRWRLLLGEAGFARVDDFLALPDCATSSYVLQTGPDVPASLPLAACAGYHLQPRTRLRRLAEWWFHSGRASAAAGHFCPSHWLLAGPRRAFRPPVLDHPNLPEGPWGLLAARGGPHQGAHAHFAALDPGTTRPHFVVKVARDPSAGGAIDREHRVLQHLHDTLSPDLRPTVPVPLERFAVHGHPAAAQSHLDGHTLARLLREAPRWRRHEAAAKLLGTAEEWLGRFHHETAHTVVLTGELLERLALSELRRCAELCAPSGNVRALLEDLADEAGMLVGNRVPLVCEHGDFRATSIRLEWGAVRVVDWNLALFDRLPLGDLYELVHSLASIVVGDRGGAGEVLAVAYGGSGRFSRAVGSILQGYCARLGIRLEWGRVLLPLHMARRTLLHAEHLHSGMEQQWLTIGVRYLEAPESFPAVTGFRAVHRQGSIDECAVGTGLRHRVGREKGVNST